MTCLFFLNLTRNFFFNPLLKMCFSCTIN